MEILFTSRHSEQDLTIWQKKYASNGILLNRLHDGECDIPIFPDFPPLLTSWKTYAWLKSKAPFDLVLFMDWQGDGFYSLHAKKSGLDFQDSALCLILHSPTLWYTTNNASFPVDSNAAIGWHMERKCIEMADAVISPSEYMLQWCRSHQFILPGAVYVQPNILEAEIRADKKDPRPVDEIVFFGRLEYRKGLAQFCNAIDFLLREKKQLPKITFLGKAGWIGEEHAIMYISRRSQNWPEEPVLKIYMGHEETLEYLSRPGRLAVMAAVANNSPYAVYECLVNGIPFLARNTGGVGELIAQEDHGKTLFGDTPPELAEKIAALIGKPAHPASLAFDLARNTEAWQNGLYWLTQKILSRGGKPLISVCLVHYNRPKLLKQAVDSLLAQDCNNFEVLLGDDGSPGEETRKYLEDLEAVFAAKGWKIFRLQHGYVGKARNFLAAQAKAEWLLFFDDDNIAMPNMVSECTKAAESRKDGFVSLMFNVFEGAESPDSSNRRERFCPVGDILSYSAINNVIGDATCLIHKDTLARCGGFSEDYGLGHEDFELLLRATLNRESCGIIPEPLFWYRRSEAKDSMLGSTNEYANRMRSLRPFMDHYPAQEAELALLACSMNSNSARLQQSREMNGPAIRNDGRDPQSSDTLSDIAEELEQSARDGLSAQIYDAIYENRITVTSGARNIIKEISGAPENARERLIHSMSHKLENLQEDERSYVCMRLRSFLPEKAANLKAELLNKAEQTNRNEPSLLLTFAEEWLMLDNRKKSLAYLLKAWVQADGEYIKRRPDVEQAIQKQAFMFPLQHFILHGVKEGMHWPHKNRFIKLLNTSAEFKASFIKEKALQYNCNQMLLSEYIEFLIAPNDKPPIAI